MEEKEIRQIIDTLLIIQNKLIKQQNEIDKLNSIVRHIDLIKMEVRRQ